MPGLTDWRSRVKAPLPIATLLRSYRDFPAEELARTCLLRHVDSEWTLQRLSGCMCHAPLATATDSAVLDRHAANTRTDGRSTEAKPYQPTRST